MSEATLEIGRLATEFQRAVAEAAQRLNIPSSAWASGNHRRSEISIFNLASVALFTDHVSKLEGFAKPGAALENTKFRNLPWWQTSIWVPVAFQPPKKPA